VAKYVHPQDFDTAESWDRGVLETLIAHFSSIVQNFKRKFILTKGHLSDCIFWATKGVAEEEKPLKVLLQSFKFA
jgi:hypothetical protein